MREALRFHPYQMLVALTLCVFGIVQLVTGQTALAVHNTLNPTLALLWTVFLIIGGASVVLGTPAKAGPAEVFGLRILGLASIIYAVCVVFNTIYHLQGVTWVATSLSAGLWASVGLAHIIRSTTVSNHWRSDRG